MTDCNALAKTQLKNNANSVAQIGVANLSTGSLAKIQEVVETKFNATHQDYLIDSNEKQMAIKEYEQLDSLINAFLGVRGDQKTSKEEIKRIRIESADYKNGRKHAFWTQQFANSSLSLEELCD